MNAGCTRNMDEGNLLNFSETNEKAGKRFSANVGF
jgi:hypothetical protein